MLNRSQPMLAYLQSIVVAIYETSVFIALRVVRGTITENTVPCRFEREIEVIDQELNLKLKARSIAIS